MTDTQQLEFDIVLATRNRQQVLQLSIPLMLAQNRLPRRFIVVDSSDDHSAARRVVEDVFSRAETPVQLLILESPTAGSSYQRNIGLHYVGSPVVIFPDDDVLWYPGTADALMRIYEKDTDRAVGCVAASVAPVYPEGVFPSNKAPYQLELRDRVAKNIRKFVGPIEGKLFSDPINPGNTWMAVWGNKTPPTWLQEEDAELCGPVFGYRMSFRTEVIRDLGGFDERLGRYSMFEDSDASIGSLRKHMNVCARRAKVFHYRVPGERVSGSEFGMMAILNRTYVVCKHSLPRSTARRKLKRYLYYKIARYLFQTYTHYGRKRFRGAFSALSDAQRLIDAPMAELSKRYIKARTDLVERSAPYGSGARQIHGA
jgi:glycosyltransferase involved in cell wall biosynthesis